MSTITLRDAPGGELVKHEGEVFVVIRRQKMSSAPGYMRRLCSLATGSLRLLPSKTVVEIITSYPGNA
jgi:hypothetical protein